MGWTAARLLRTPEAVAATASLRDPSTRDRRPFNLDAHDINSKLRAADRKLAGRTSELWGVKLDISTENVAVGSAKLEIDGAKLAIHSGSRWF